mmetsp:Transcript_4814/g.14729  ORF Transcript_4814/g.14729 Transcript_4814/m.14729 type:complete len:308 (+) Transcript_4814:708-1631(+)
MAASARPTPPSTFGSTATCRRRRWTRSGSTMRWARRRKEAPSWAPSRRKSTASSRCERSLWRLCRARCSRRSRATKTRSGSANRCCSPTCSSSPLPAGSASCSRSDGAPPSKRSGASVARGAPPRSCCSCTSRWRTGGCPCRSSSHGWRGMSGRHPTSAPAHPPTRTASSSASSSRAVPSMRRWGSSVTWVCLRRPCTVASPMASPRWCVRWRRTAQRRTGTASSTCCTRRPARASGSGPTASSTAAVSLASASPTLLRTQAHGSRASPRRRWRRSASIRQRVTDHSTCRCGAQTVSATKATPSPSR